MRILKVKSSMLEVSFSVPAFQSRVGGKREKWAEAIGPLRTYPLQKRFTFAAFKIILVKRQANAWSVFVLSLLSGTIFLPPSRSTVASHANVLRLVTRSLGGLIYDDHILSEAQEKTDWSITVKSGALTQQNYCLIWILRHFGLASRKHALRQAHPL